MNTTSNLNAAREARVNNALDKQYRFSDGKVRSLRDHFAAQRSIKKDETDGMIEYNRRKFNQMGSHKEQDEYMARLKAKRLYFINDIKVPKIVFDAIEER